MSTTIDLSLVGTPLRLNLRGPLEPCDLARVRGCYEHALSPRRGSALEIDVALEDGVWTASSARTETREVGRVEDLVPLVDEQIVLALQHARPELLFLHAGVLEFRGRAVLLLAESGSGKSTTCLGLVRHGLGFFSDELAPYDAESGTVTSFPRALCLKSEPPEGFGDDVQEHRGRYYASLAPASFDRLDLAALLFVRYDPANREPQLMSLSPAQATLRLAAQGLNLLAHDDFALDELSAMALSAPSFQLASADLGATCDAVLAELAQID
ncbi:MAG: hypothetical protein AAGK22_11415 [Acidobacteriota bacterium]